MTQKLALVTGGAGDIGRAIAHRLMQDHDRVILADIDRPAAEAAVTQLNRALSPKPGQEGEPDQGGSPGRGFIPRTLDVTDAQSCADAATAVAGLGQLVTLVNNAGASHATGLQSTAPAHWKADTALNLDAAFLMFQAFADQLTATKGSVINIASVNGTGVFGHPAYSAAKAGMIHLTKLIAVEYGRYGIRANSVAPGTVRTQAWEERAANNPLVFEQAAAHYPLARLVRPADVAEAVGFLASPLASAISGVCLPVDCGLTAGVPALAHTFSQSDDYCRPSRPPLS